MGVLVKRLPLPLHQNQPTPTSKTTKDHGAKNGRAARTWLLSWLPDVDSLDLVMLLAFWSRDMTLFEDFSDTMAPTAYKAVAVGEALRIRFPDDDPLPAEALRELCMSHRELQSALRKGTFYGASLPSLQTLRRWGFNNLMCARVETAETLLDLPKTKRYTHHHRIGSTFHFMAPTTRLAEPVPGHKFVGPESGPAVARPGAPPLASPKDADVRVKAAPGNFATLLKLPMQSAPKSGKSVLAAQAKLARQFKPTQWATACPQDPPPRDVECVYLAPPQQRAEPV